MWKITLLLASLLLIFIAVPKQGAEAKVAQIHALQSSANDLIAEVNALRIANGLTPYTINPILMQLAQEQANYMAATGQVAHRSGLTQRILTAGYPLAGDLSQGGFRAENVSGAQTAAQAVQRWTGDALHLNTMLSPNLSEIGAGVAQVGDRHYMTILCAQPTTGGIPQAYTPNPDSVATESFSPGDFIVPITVSTPDGSGMVYHEVQNGQSLWSIAIAYGVKIDDIRMLNNLGAGIEIYQGEKLLVRIDAPPETTLSPNASPAATTPSAISMVVSTDTVIVPSFTEFPISKPQPQASNTMAGMAIGIALVAILFTGLWTWMSSRKSV